MPSSAYRLAAATTSPLRMGSSKTCDMLSSGPSLAAAPAAASAVASRAKRNEREDFMASSWCGFRGVEYGPAPASAHCRRRPGMLDYAPAGERNAKMSDEQVVWTGS